MTTCLMIDSLIPRTTETQSLRDALHRADIHVGSPTSKNATAMAMVVEQRRLDRHSTPQINQD